MARFTSSHTHVFTPEYLIVPKSDLMYIVVHDKDICIFVLFYRTQPTSAVASQYDAIYSISTVK